MNPSTDYRINRSLDKDAIRADADILIVAEELGVDITTRGTKRMILCPWHDDHHLGSCFISDRKIECYSCHKKWDVFDFVQRIADVGFWDAVRIVADINGGAELYQLSKEAVEARADDIRFIKQNDRDFIGLHSEPVYTLVGITYDYDALPELREQGFVDEIIESTDGTIYGYALKKRIEANPLYTLYKENFEVYQQLIDKFCSETIRKYEFAMVLIENPALSPIHADSLQRVISQVPRNEWLSFISGLIQRARKISMQYGTGNLPIEDACTEAKHKQITRTANTAIVAITANDMWKKDDAEAPF